MKSEQFIYYISLANDIFCNGNFFDKAVEYFKKARDIYESEDENFQDKYRKIMNDSSKHYYNYLKKQSETEYKKENYRKALLLYEDLMFSKKNDDAISYYNMAECYRRIGALKTAIRFYEEALKKNPDNFDIYRVFGDLYRLMKEEDIKKKNKNLLLSIKNYEKYITYYTNNAPVYSVLADLYTKIDNEHLYWDKQLTYFKKALELSPDMFDANKNIAAFYSDKKCDYEKALYHYDKTLTKNSDHNHLFLYAAFLIKYKQFTKGWKLYDHRFEKESNATPYPKIEKPKWRGENIKKKILLVQNEQGYGDSLMFLRFIKDVCPLAKKVIFRVQNHLYNFLTENDFPCEVIKESSGLETVNFDYHVPLLNIPHIINLQPDSIPSAPYLKANDEKALYFKNKYFNNNKKKIGFVFTGNPKFYNKNRNLPVESITSFSSIKDAEFYSFQYELREKDFAPFSSDIKITPLGAEFKDFSYTAAALRNLDFLVTSDNGVLHLAGALGVRTICLLNCDAEYRWMNESGKCSWYDSVYIIRQSWDKTWDSAIKEAINYIEKS